MIWCIAALTQEYQRRMYHLLDLYALPFRRGEPVVCVDEKSLQLLAHSRTPMPMKPGRLRKESPARSTIATAGAAFTGATRMATILRF